ncbi:MAG: hypothetical protein JW783_08905 [Bacteroidales bacterium]|nr:hypothetical protein [Bacteroidales bacterium]MBN2750138.1 hypothetical protein [Bacteroidales bacterium]
MRKQLLFTLTIAFLQSSITFAQSNTREKAEEVLKIARLTHIASSTGSHSHLEPADYIVDSTSGRINGQQFLVFETEKYYPINVIWDGDEITKVRFNNYKECTLTWKDGKIINISKDEHSSDYNYRISYSEDGDGETITFTENKLLGGKTLVVKEIVYKDNKVQKVSAYYNKTKKPCIGSLHEYTYRPNEIAIKITTYESCKTKEVRSVERISFAIKENNTAKTTYEYEDEDELSRSNEYTYNEHDKIDKQISIRGKNTTLTTYEYYDNKLFRRVETSTVSDEFHSKMVSVLFDLPEQDSTKPIYERENGFYKLNKEGNLIYEKKGFQYRELINGIWSDWKYTIQ